MQITIQGKRKNKDVVLTDDRLICGRDELLYKDISRIWTSSLFSDTIDCTYKGRHQAFKIDPSAKEAAQEAVLEVQKRIDAGVDTEIAALDSDKSPEAFFAFISAHGLREVGVSSGWFCKQMTFILAQLEKDEKALLPFEAACGLSVAMNGNLTQCIALQQRQMAGLLTDRRLILFSYGVMGVKDQLLMLPLDAIRAVRPCKQNGWDCIAVAGTDRTDNVLLGQMQEAPAKIILRTLRGLLPADRFLA